MSERRSVRGRDRACETEREKRRVKERVRERDGQGERWLGRARDR